MVKEKLLANGVLTYPNIKLVYFDVGGVLFRFKGGLHDIANKVGLSYENCEKIWLEMDDSICRGETPPQELWTRIKEASGYRGDDINFVSFWVDHFQPILKTHKLVQDLSEHCCVGLLANIYPGVYQLALEKGKIPNIPYASVILSCEVGEIKPNSAIYELAQQRGNVKPGEILFIDDSSRFITPAINLGWHTFLFDGRKAAKNVVNLRHALGL